VASLAPAGGVAVPPGLTSAVDGALPARRRATMVRIRPLRRHVSSAERADITRCAQPTSSRTMTMRSKLLATPPGTAPAAAFPPARPPEAAAITQVIPPPAVDPPAAEATGTETAVLAGGCFWGLQGMFEHVNGVTKVVAGYSGGAKSTAHYE